MTCPGLSSAARNRSACTRSDRRELPTGQNYNYPLPDRGAARRSRQRQQRPLREYVLAGLSVTYRGYFDCALTTPCPGGGLGSAPVRDQRAAWRPRGYLIPALRMSSGGLRDATQGMVFTYVNVSLGGDFGTRPRQTDGLNMYVMRPGDFSDPESLDPRDHRR